MPAAPTAPSTSPWTRPGTPSSPAWSHGPGRGSTGALAKYAPNGFRRWRTWISTVGVGEDRPSALALAGTGRIVVVGQFSSKTRAEDAVVASYSDKGRLIWRRVWQGLGPAEDLLNAVAVGARGHRRRRRDARRPGRRRRPRPLVLGGRRPSLERSRRRRRRAGGADRFATVALTSRGGVIAGGSATMSSASGDDAVVARFAADDGAQTAWWPWDAGADDAVVDLRLTGGEVFAAGRSGASGGLAGTARRPHAPTSSSCGRRWRSPARRRAVWCRSRRECSWPAPGQTTCWWRRWRASRAGPAAIR